MNTALLFAKLSSKAADYSFMPFSNISHATNLSLFTKGMYRKGYIAGRFVWSKDLGATKELMDYVMDQLRRVAKQEKWRCSDSRLRTLAQLALIEHHEPGIFRTQKSRYVYCHIKQRDWFRLWQKRYEVAYKVISSYLDIAWGSLHE